MPAAATTADATTRPTGETAATVPTAPGTGATSAADAAALRTELHEAVGRLGQLDGGDPRWPALDAQLDRLVRWGLALTADVRAPVWRAAATDPAAARVVKLRVLAQLVRADG